MLAITKRKEPFPRRLMAILSVGLTVLIVGSAVGAGILEGTYAPADTTLGRGYALAVILLSPPVILADFVAIGAALFPNASTAWRAVLSVAALALTVPACFGEFWLIVVIWRAYQH